MMAISLALAAMAGGDGRTACARVERAVARGALLAAADLGPGTDCPADGHVGGVGFDRGAAAWRAKRDLAAGEIVPALPVSLVPAVRKGEGLFMLSTVGAIAVERPVTALQSGRAGGRIFVITADGAVMPVQIGKGPP